MIFAMTWPLLEGPGFDRSARRHASLQISSAMAALLTAGGLSLSLVVAIGILSFDFFRTAPTWML